MKNKLHWLVFSAVAALLCPPSANAQTSGGETQAQSNIFKSGDLTIQAGIRVWGNEWDVPVFETKSFLSNGALVSQTDVTTRRSNFKFAPIPVLGVTYGRFAANVTYMIPTHYDTGAEGLSSVRREEFDASVGYSVLPPGESVLLATVSYKYAKIGALTTSFDSPTTINAILFGLSGSAPLYGNLRLIGSFAIGPARQRLNTPFGEAKDNGLYRVVEIGVGYPLISAPAGPLRSLFLTATYRAQIYTVKGVDLTTIQNGQVTNTESRDVTSTTQGPVIGLIGSF